jgi:hypothetical protein
MPRHELIEPFSSPTHRRIAGIHRNQVGLGDGNDEVESGQAQGIPQAVVPENFQDLTSPRSRGRLAAFNE